LVEALERGLGKSLSEKRWNEDDLVFREGRGRRALEVEESEGCGGFVVRLGGSRHKERYGGEGQVDFGEISCC